MINPTQISSGIKTVSKMVSKPEIVNNIARKVKPKDEKNKDKNNRKKNDTRF